MALPLTVTPFTNINDITVSPLAISMPTKRITKRESPKKNRVTLIHFETVLHNEYRDHLSNRHCHAEPHIATHRRNGCLKVTSSFLQIDKSDERIFFPNEGNWKGMKKGRNGDLSRAACLRTFLRHKLFHYYASRFLENRSSAFAELIKIVTIPISMRKAFHPHPFINIPRYINTPSFSFSLPIDPFAIVHISTGFKNSFPAWKIVTPLTSIDSPTEIGLFAKTAFVSILKHSNVHFSQ